MDKRTIVALTAVALVLVALLVWFVSRDTPQEAEPGSTTVVLADDGTPMEGVPVRLFFPGSDGLLHVELRAVQNTDAAGEEIGPEGGRGSNESDLEQLRTNPTRLAAEAVRALLAGPTDENLRPAFDQGTELAGLRIDATGVAIVSLSPPPGSVNQGLSSREELLRLYSLVDSLAYSISDVKSALVIWAGSQPVTLGGHVDTTRPLKPSLDWVAAESRERLTATAERAAAATRTAGSTDDPAEAEAKADADEGDSDPEAP